LGRFSAFLGENGRKEAKSLIFNQKPPFYPLTFRKNNVIPGKNNIVLRRNNIVLAKTNHVLRRINVISRPGDIVLPKNNLTPRPNDMVSPRNNPVPRRNNVEICACLVSRAAQSSREHQRNWLMALYDSGIHYDDPTAFYDSVDQPTKRKPMAQFALQLSKKDLDEKLVMCQSLETKLTGNANVPTPAPSIANLTAKRTAIVAKRLDIVNARETVTQLENELANLETDLDGMLTTEAATITSATLGDKAKMLTTGLPVKGVATPIGPLPAPQNLAARGGDMEGTVDVNCDPVKGSSSYTAQQSTSATGPWTSFYVGTKSSATAEGLTSGTLYYFRMNAVGAKGPGPWSDIAQKRAT
jgi:hypothetical protein